MLQTFQACLLDSRPRARLWLLLVRSTGPARLGSQSCRPGTGTESDRLQVKLWGKHEPELMFKGT